MRIGFWNVERAGNLSGAGGLRGGLMLAYLNEWLTNLKPDVVILCEVTSGGHMDILAEVSSVAGYKGEFVRVADKNGNTSPCSFLIIAKQGYYRPVAAVGASTKRPYVMIEAGGFLIAGCHIIATRGEPSAAEMFDMTNDMGASRAAKCILIGDMNFPFGADPGVIGWTKVDPGIPATHKSDSSKPGSVIDYLWYLGQITCVPVVVCDYTDWDTIDHAPICYDLV